MSDQRSKFEKEQEHAKKLESQRAKPLPPTPTPPPLPSSSIDDTPPPPPPYKELMTKVIGDLRRVSGVVQNASGVRRVESITETLDDLIDDESLDPMARQIAEQYARYLPLEKEFLKSPDKEMDIGNGERMVKSGKGGAVHVMRGDQLVCRVYDDQRGMDMTARAFSQMLESDTPRGADGAIILSSYMDGSEMSQNVSSGLLDITQHLERSDRDKVRTSVHEGYTKLGGSSMTGDRAKRQRALKQVQKTMTPESSINL